MKKSLASPLTTSHLDREPTTADRPAAAQRHAADRSRSVDCCP
jgi:hypothetical protein